MKKLISLFAIIALLSACNSNKPDNSNSANETTISNQYTFQRTFTTLKWTAFKTSARIPVGGTFDEFEVTTGKESGSVTDILNGLTFNILVASSNSAEEDRDGKIAKYFYGTMLGTDKITGAITGFDGNDSAGKVKIKIIMNEVGSEVEGSYVMEGDKLILTAQLNLADWKAEKALKSLNDVCSDLHKGDDGISKLWPKVDVVVESILSPIEASKS